MIDAFLGRLFGEIRFLQGKSVAENSTDVAASSPPNKPQRLSASARDLPIRIRRA